MNDEQKAGVYSIRNTLNGKQYIGSAATSFARRWACHKSILKKGKHHSTHLQSAWNKDGGEFFEFRILEVTRPEWAVAVEQVFIDAWKTSNAKYGYNIAPTAGSTRGRKCSDETKCRIVAALTGVKRGPVSDEHRAKLISASQLRIGVKHTPETRAKIAAARLGKKFGPLTSETKEKLAAANRGKHVSDETRRKLSIAATGKKKTFSAEHRQHLSEAGRKRAYKPHSEEAKRKMSIAAKGRRFTQEHKERLSKATKEAWSSGRKTADKTVVDTQAPQQPVCK